MPDDRLPLNELQRQILAVLRQFPDGVSIDQIRSRVSFSGTQQHFDRRVRSLRSWFEIRWDAKTGYRLIAQRSLELDSEPIPARLQAEIRNRDGGRCQYCGRTVADDHIRTHIDHKVPRTWGGATDPSNLWTLCSECNENKRDYFAAFDMDFMREAVSQPNVWARLGKALELGGTVGILDHVMQAVAGTGYRDWGKRTRELRVLGWRYRTKRERDGIRNSTRWILLEQGEMPADPAAEIRRREKRAGTRR